VLEFSITIQQNRKLHICRVSEYTTKDKDVGREYTWSAVSLWGLFSIPPGKFVALLPDNSDNEKLLDLPEFGREKW
jgi:hypothetical protein